MESQLLWIVFAKFKWTRLPAAAAQDKTKERTSKPKSSSVLNVCFCWKIRLLRSAHKVCTTASGISSQMKFPTALKWPWYHSCAYHWSLNAYQHWQGSGEGTYQHWNSKWSGEGTYQHWQGLCLRPECPKLFFLKETKFYKQANVV